MRKVQAAGIGILLALAFTHTASAAGLTQAQRERADNRAEAALAASTTESRAFRRCIRAGSRVHIRGTFIGRQCVAPDGERWYAGTVWVNGEPTLNTGP